MRSAKAHLRIGLVALALAGLALGVVGQADAGTGSTPIVVGVGGTAKPPLSGPTRLTSTGYGPGVAVGEDGTAHVAWQEPSPDNLDTVHYCRVVRPGTTCTDPKTFNPPGFMSPDQNGRFARDGAHSMFVLTPRPDEVVLITTRYRNPAEPGIAVGSDGVVGGCGGANPCFESHNPVFAFVSRDNGATFQQRLIGEQRGGVVAIGVMTVDDGTANERDLFLLFGDQNRLVVSSDRTFAISCIDLSGPGGNLPIEAGLGVRGATALLAFNQGDSVFTRRFAATPGANGSQTISDLCDESKWSAWGTASGQNNSARVASGDRGHFLLTDRQGASNQRVVRDLTNSDSGTTTLLGRAHSTGDLTRRGDIALDGLGGLTAAWIDPRIKGKRLVGHDLLMGRAPTASPFLAGTTLRQMDRSTGNPDVERLHMGALDDGGAIVYQHAGGTDVNAPASISMLLFGSRTPRPVADVHIAGAEVTQGIQASTPLSRTPSSPPRR